MLIHCQDEFPI